MNVSSSKKIINSTEIIFFFHLRGITPVVLRINDLKSSTFMPYIDKGADNSCN